MNGLDEKKLKKLATACRKMGIVHFKCQDFEFTLSPDAPQRKARAAKGKESSAEELFESDSLTPDQALFWSSEGLAEQEAGLKA